jgi:hypothetical protein
LFAFALVAPAQAQVAPEAPPSAASEPPLVALELPPPVAPIVSIHDPLHAAVLTKQLLAIEQQSQELEAKRVGVRTLGYRIGKIVSWSASALFLLTAFSWYGSAESVQQALKDGRDDKAYDVNGNHKVTKHDEDVARVVARTLAVTSLIPIGLGVFTTLMGMRREREKRDYSNALEDLAGKRRSLLRRLDAQLSASQSHAALQLRMTF